MGIDENFSVSMGNDEISYVHNDWVYTTDELYVWMLFHDLPRHRRWSVQWDGEATRRWRRAWFYRSQNRVYWRLVLGPLVIVRLT